MFVGIDPGKSGGIALIPQCGCSCKAFIMPLKDGVIDIQAIDKQVFSITLAVIENVHAFPGQGVVSTFTFGKMYGMLLGWLEMRYAKYVVVDPRKWKNRILDGTTKDKEAAISYAKETYPDVDLTPGRIRTPHDGIADAVCMAEYARRLADDYVLQKDKA